MTARDRFPLDFSALEPPARPNWYLVLPQGFEARTEPHLRLQAEPAPGRELLDRLIKAGLADPRTKMTRQDGLQVEFEQKSAVWGFRDLITATVFEMAPGQHALAIYSRALMGHYDFGVNAKRITRWLDRYQADGSAK
ncbi:MAG: DUF1499 domain-containing protein [Caulobacterales bacterium]|uniref:DUF1499 domain-containing protein n=1 Tax=Glycocaulis sp. TaxID=1969725 RepID=UPI003FA07EE6